jgi:secondary thiamine-phosphate synthase enzyme
MRHVPVRTTKREELVCITDRINDVLAAGPPDLSLCLVFCPHSTAGLTVNEAADPDVAVDLVHALGHLVDGAGPWRHREGNSAAHVKASLMGCSLVLPVANRALDLGRWQGVFFCEFDGPRSRGVWVQNVS